MAERRAGALSASKVLVLAHLRHAGESTPVRSPRPSAADMADRDAWLTAALSELTEAEVDLLRIAGRLMDRLAQAPGG
jgi:hypothetical protein